jgi:succinoglycan biosynthesis protein ExoO
MQAAPASATPDVSVIIAAWKAAAFIRRAIESALASEGVSLEVIVVDDASPDNTFSVVKVMAARDARVRVERLETNGGPSAARNRAIEIARGEFIAVLDADDAMDAGRLRDLVALARDSRADIAVDNLLEVDELNRPIGDGRFLKSGTFQRPQQITLETWIRYNQPMARGDCLGYLKPLFRRASLERLAVKYDPALRNSEDYYIIAHMLAAGASMAYAPSCSYRYTRSSASTSHRLKPEQTQAWLKAESDFTAAHAATVDAISARSPARIVRTLAADPAGWPFTISWFGKIAADKLRAKGRRTPA